MHTLWIQIQRERDEINITGALAIAKQTTFYAIRTGHYRQFRRCHSGAAVIMRVYADDDGVAVIDVAMHPLNLVGVGIRRAHLHGCR